MGMIQCKWAHADQPYHLIETRRQDFRKADIPQEEYCQQKSSWYKERPKNDSRDSEFWLPDAAVLLRQLEARFMRQELA